MKYTPPTVANGHVYVATKTSVQVYGPTGKAKTPFAAQTLPTSTTSGAAITMSYNTNPTWPSNVTACPVFSPASSYNFVIQPCTLESQSGNVGKSSGAFPICESAASLSGGTVTGLTTGVSLIIGQSQQINLPAGTYEILPSGNNIPSNGGAEAVLGSAQLFVNPATFTVQANQYTPVPTSFFCGISNGTATTPVPSSGSN